MVSLRDKWFCESLVMASSKRSEFALERVDSAMSKDNESTNVRERERARLGFEGQCPPNTDKKVLKIISLSFPYYMMLYI